MPQFTKKSNYHEHRLHINSSFHIGYLKKTCFITLTELSIFHSSIFNDYSKEEFNGCLSCSYLKKRTNKVFSVK